MNKSRETLTNCTTYENVLGVFAVTTGVSAVDKLFHEMIDVGRAMEM